MDDGLTNRDKITEFEIEDYFQMLTIHGKQIRNRVRWRFFAILAYTLAGLLIIDYILGNNFLKYSELLLVGLFLISIGVLLSWLMLSKVKKVLSGNSLENKQTITDLWNTQANKKSNISNRDYQMYDLLAIHVLKASHNEIKHVSGCPICELILSSISPEFKENHVMNATFQYLEETEAVSEGELISKLSEAISGKNTGFIDPEGASVLTNELIQLGSPIETLLQTTDHALIQIGQSFEKRDIYYPQVLQAALAAKNTLNIIEDESLTHPRQERNNRILLGVIKGDIHDIGKNIVKMFLEFNGYDVIDLGVDISPTEFVNAITQYTPDLVGISAFINTVIPAFKETVSALRNSGYEKPIISGGIAINALTINKLRKELDSASPGTSGEIIYAHNVQEVLKSVKSIFHKDSQTSLAV